jgi:hypothetical protein
MSPSEQRRTDIAVMANISRINQRKGKSKMAKNTQNKRTSIHCELDLAAGELVIRMPISIPPSPSASGKTLVVASTRGNVQTEATYDGKAITLGVNAYVKK